MKTLLFLMHLVSSFSYGSSDRYLINIDKQYENDAQQWWDNYIFNSYSYENEIIYLDSKNLTNNLVVNQTLSNLKYLWLNNNEINYFIVQRNSLINLEALYLSNNSIFLFNNNFNKLKLLDLSFNRLNFFIINENYFPNLEDLYLNDNQLTMIDVSQLYSSNLNLFNVRNNFCLKIIFINQEQKNNLTNFYWNDENQIILYSDEEESYLKLGNAQVYWDDNAISNLNNTLIDLSNKNLTGFLTIWKTEYSDKIKKLNLSLNNLTCFTFKKDSLPNLEYLFLNNNNLNFFPFSYSLNSIVWLDLSKNNLNNTLMIKNLFPQLRFLVLDSNYLNSFNPAENYLPKLESLYLQNNELTNFSLATSFFPRLRYLDLQNNEIIKIRYFLPFRYDFILLSNNSYSEIEYIY